MLNGEIGTKDKTQDHLCDVSVKISCPADSGGGICAWLCVYAFGDVWIVVYDVGGCHMSVVINLERVPLRLWLCMDFVMFLVFFWDNQYDIITIRSDETKINC